MKATAVQEFRELVFKRYGIALSDAEAMEQAGNLLRFYKTVYGTYWADTADTTQNQTIS